MTKLFATLCLALFQTPMLADAVPAQEPPLLPARRFVHDGITATLAMPTEVLVHQSRSFPVRIRVWRENGHPPDKITLLTAGKIQVGDQIGEGEMDIPLRHGSGAAIIIVDTATGYNERLTVDAKISKDPGAAFIGTAAVLLRGPASLRLADTPDELVADGRSVKAVTAIVKDQFGKPLEGVPFMAVGQRQDAKKYAEAVHSDAQGIVTFVVPASTEEGPFTLQFEGESLVTGQLILQYKKPAQPDAK